MNRMNIESVTVRIDVPPEGKGVHVKGDLPMVNVDGLAHGKLSVAWSGNTMRFSGQIRADETSLQLLQFVRQEAKVAPAFSASPQPESDPFYYEVALGFTSGKSVEFFWPNRSIPILRTYLDLDQTLRIVYDSLSGTWSLNGNLKARGGELVFLKRNFLIREAALLFAENQDKFDPRITGRAETRMSYGDKPVKVSLVLENNTLGNLTPRISTDTPLSGEQLNSILIGDTLNIANEETKGAQDLYNLASSAVAMVSQIGVLDPLMSKVLDPVRLALGLDLLTVRSNILSTMAVDSFFNLGGYNPLDNQSCIIGM